MIVYLPSCQGQKTMTKWPVFQWSCHLSSAHHLPDAIKASYCPFWCRTSSRKLWIRIFTVLVVYVWSLLQMQTLYPLDEKNSRNAQRHFNIVLFLKVCSYTHNLRPSINHSLSGSEKAADLFQLFERPNVWWSVLLVVEIEVDLLSINFLSAFVRFFFSIKKLCSFFVRIFIRTVTIRRGRLGAGRLGAAD